MNYSDSAKAMREVVRMRRFRRYWGHVMLFATWIAFLAAGMVLQTWVEGL